MQEAEEPARGGTATQAAEPARTLSPIAAFLIVLAIGAVALGAFLLTREEEPGEPSARGRGPALALTDEEAIERFKELDELRLRAYRRRDLSLLSRVFIPGSRIEKTVADEIRNLIRSDVVARPTFETESLELMDSKDSEITVRQTVEKRSRFLNEAGRDVTVNEAHQRLVIDWHVVRVDTQWLIEDAKVVRAVDLPEQENS